MGGKDRAKASRDAERRGRRPNLLLYKAIHETIRLLSQDLSEDPPPPVERKALVFLALTMAWWHGASQQERSEVLRWINRPGELRKALQSRSLSLGALSEETLGEIVPLLPEESQRKEAESALSRGDVKGCLRVFREYLGGKWNYPARELAWTFLARMLKAPSSVKPPDLGVSCAPPCRAPCRAELILALLPLLPLRKAFFALLSSSWDLEDCLIQEAVSPLFLYGFIRDAHAALGWPPLFRSSGCCECKSDCSGSEVLQLTWCEGEQEPVVILKREEESPQGKDKRQRLRAFLWNSESFEAEVLPSPNLAHRHGRKAMVLTQWFQLANGVLEAFLSCCSKDFLPCHGKDFLSCHGVDEDLVREYHEAMVRALETGGCPDFMDCSKGGCAQGVP